MANLTKNDMARVIAQALYAMKALPAADDRRVLKLAKRSKERLTGEHRMAMRVLQGEGSPAYVEGQQWAVSEVVEARAAFKA